MQSCTWRDFRAAGPSSRGRRLRVRRHARYGLAILAMLLCVDSTALAADPAPRPAAHSHPAAMADAGALQGQLVGRCPMDATLSRAAADLLVSHAEPTQVALQAALVAAGSSAVAVDALFLPVRLADQVPATVSDWLSRRATRTGGPLICGEALGDAGGLWLVANGAGRLEVLSQDPLQVRGVLAAGHHAPELVVAYADGALRQLAPSVSELGRGVVVERSGRAVRQIQLLATGPGGPAPVARWRSVAPDVARWRSAAPAQPDSGPRATRKALAWSVAGQLNALRRAHGVVPVRRHRLLREVASRHAHRVCATGRVSHVLDRGLDPEARIRAEGIEVQRVGEAIARVGDVAQAFSALASSPSHLRTLTQRRFSDAGVGLARDDRGQVCVVVLLALWPRYVGPGRAE